jgi:anti-sigma B factor antagonist
LRWRGDYIDGSGAIGNQQTNSIGGQKMTNHLDEEMHGDAVAVHFRDKNIDTELASGGVGEELYALVSRFDGAKLVLSFSGVEFLCSAMLGKLISANKRMADKGGLLRLCEMCPNIRAVFRFTRLDRIFDIRDTVALALEA